MEIRDFMNLEVTTDLMVSFSKNVGLKAAGEAYPVDSHTKVWFN
jgi:hypothetical protein